MNKRLFLCSNQTFVFLGVRIKSLTFELCSAGVDVHPLLAFSTAHQEAGHSLPGKESVCLRNLATAEGGRNGGLRRWDERMERIRGIFVGNVVDIS